MRWAMRRCTAARCCPRRGDLARVPRHAIHTETRDESRRCALLDAYLPITPVLSRVDQTLHLLLLARAALPIIWDKRSSRAGSFLWALEAGHRFPRVHATQAPSVYACTNQCLVTPRALSLPRTGGGRAARKWSCGSRVPVLYNSARLCRCCSAAARRVRAACVAKHDASPTSRQLLAAAR